MGWAIFEAFEIGIPPVVVWFNDSICTLACDEIDDLTLYQWQAFSQVLRKDYILHALKIILVKVPCQLQWVVQSALYHALG
jgi:hypothetical protein